MPLNREAPGGEEALFLGDLHTLLQFSEYLHYFRGNGGASVAAALLASPNIEDALNYYSTPGVLFLASEDFAVEYDVASLLDELAQEYDCVYDGRYEYERPLYSGLYDLYTDCADVGSTIIELAVAPESGNLLAYLRIQMVGEADFAARDRILETFYVAE